jgi:hypothetical protein
VFSFKATSKGHLIGSFKDRYGAECSVQESSYPDEPCIWLGVEVDSGGESVPNGRMHLNQEAAQEMIDVLRYFVNEGTLGQYSGTDFGVGSWVRGVGKGNHDVHGRVVEVKSHEVIVIQDQSKPGEAGRYTCLWEEVHKLWEPDLPPPEGRSVYQHILDD